MPLNPLGLHNPLLPPLALGRNFQSLGQSLTPLGQNSQAAEFLSPLVQTQQDPLTFEGEVEPSWSNFSPALTDSSESSITAESNQESRPASNPAVVSDNITDVKASFSASPGDSPTTTNSPPVTDNIVPLKPLGLSKPLAQNSNFLTSETIASSSFSNLINKNEVVAFTDSSTTAEPNQESRPEPNPAVVSDNITDIKASFSALLGDSPAITNSPAATDNIVPLKPLGLSKPLAQNSNFLTSKFVAEFSPEAQSSTHSISQGQPAKLQTQPSDSISEDVAVQSPDNSVDNASQAITNNAESVVQPQLEAPEQPANLQTQPSDSIREDVVVQSSDDSADNAPQAVTNNVEPVVQTQLEPTQQPAKLQTQPSDFINENVAVQSSDHSVDNASQSVTNNAESVVQPQIETPQQSIALQTHPSDSIREDVAVQSLDDSVDNAPQAVTNNAESVVQPQVKTPQQPAILQTQPSDFISEDVAVESVDESADNAPQAVTNNAEPVVQPQLETPQQPAILQTQLSDFISEDVAVESLDENVDNAPPAVTNNAEPVVQPKLETPQQLNESLPIIKPLGQSSPLVQESDLQVSQLVAEFSESSPINSQEIPRLSNNNSTEQVQLPEENLPNTPLQKRPDSQVVSATNSGDIPAAWSSISELLDATSGNTAENQPPLNPLGFTKPLNGKNNFISPKLDLGLEATEEEPQVRKFGETPNNPQSLEDLPNSWSSLSELLGENPTAAANNQLAENEFAPTFPSPPEETPLLNSPIPTSGELSATSQQLKADIPLQDSSVTDEQLEILAQKVYTHLQKQLELDGERRGNKAIGYPTWLSNITPAYGTSTKANSGFSKAEEIGEPFPPDSKLQILTQEVYLLMRHRLEIEQERQGRYYTTRSFM